MLTFGYKNLFYVDDETYPKSYTDFLDNVNKILIERNRLLEMVKLKDEYSICKELCEILYDIEINEDTKDIIKALKEDIEKEIEDICKRQMKHYCR